MPARMSFPIPNMQYPLDGGLAVPVAVDLTGGLLARNVDLTQEQSQGMIDMIQSIYIDNRAGGQTLLFTFAGMQYTIQVKAARQGIWPVLMPQGRVVFDVTATVAPNAIIPVIVFNNVPQSYFVWDV